MNVQDASILEKKSNNLSEEAKKDPLSFTDSQIRVKKSRVVISWLTNFQIYKFKSKIRYFEFY
jgi:hypothetical protein